MLGLGLDIGIRFGGTHATLEVALLGKKKHFLTAGAP